MRMPLLVFALVGLMACSQEDLLQKFSSPEDQAVARGYIDQLRGRKFEEIEKALDSSIRTANIRDTLKRMADAIPAGEPSSVKLVGAQRFVQPGATRVNTTFEYRFGDQWLLANVAVQEKSGAKTIVGFNVNPMTQSLEEQNRFTLSGKGPVHYTVLLAAVAAALVTLYALVACARTKPLKLKWLWLVFILLGFGKVAVNWTTGQWRMAPLAVQLFSASAVAPLYGSWTVAASFPLGAIVFLFYRKLRSAGPQSAQA